MTVDNLDTNLIYILQRNISAPLPNCSIKQLICNQWLMLRSPPAGPTPTTGETVTLSPSHQVDTQRMNEYYGLSSFRQIMFLPLASRQLVLRLCCIFMHHGAQRDLQLPLIHSPSNTKYIDKPGTAFLAGGKSGFSVVLKVTLTRRYLKPFVHHWLVFSTSHSVGLTVPQQ